MERGVGQRPALEISWYSIGACCVQVRRRPRCVPGDPGSRRGGTLVDFGAQEADGQGEELGSPTSVPGAAHWSAGWDTARAAWRNALRSARLRPPARRRPGARSARGGWCFIRSRTITRSGTDLKIRRERKGVRYHEDLFYQTFLIVSDTFSSSGYHGLSSPRPADQGSRNLHKGPRSPAPPPFLFASPVYSL
jgi:hypothetical protein